MSATELKFLLAHWLNEPVTFKHLLALMLAVWIYKKLRSRTANPHPHNSRDAINRATYSPKQFRGRGKQEQDW